MQAYAESNIGLVREENQDVYRLVKVDSRTALFLVCDGMGGASGGKEAATVAADTFAAAFCESFSTVVGEQRPTPFAVQRVFSGAVYRANLAVFERAVAEPSLSGMGTTLSAACISGNMLFIANIGDSRVYLIRDGGARQLTRDDSLVQQLVDEGELSTGAARDSEYKHLLTRALGLNPYVEFSFLHETLRSADRVLLCSDGLSAYHTEQSIASLARTGNELRTAVHTLVSDACLAGGRDNITCVLVEV